jgi:hypothetical protein
MTPTMAHMRCDGAVAVLATQVVHLARYTDRAFANPGMRFDRRMALETLTSMEEEIGNIKAALARSAVQPQEIAA